VRRGLHVAGRRSLQGQAAIGNRLLLQSHRAAFGKTATDAVCVVAGDLRAQRGRHRQGI
jgi:hypothetical protein